jgi:hypothetical protein
VWVTQGPLARGMLLNAAEQWLQLDLSQTAGLWPLSVPKHPALHCSVLYAAEAISCPWHVWEPRLAMLTRMQTHPHVYSLCQ